MTETTTIKETTMTTAPNTDPISHYLVTFLAHGERYENRVSTRTEAEEVFRSARITSWVHCPRLFAVTANGVRDCLIID